MPFPLSLQQPDYEALIALARKGATTQDQILALDQFLKQIESANGLTRYLILVQYQELDSPVPPTARFPETWPPELRFKIEFISRPVARADVDAALKVKAKNPTSVLCTKDPAGIVGWAPLDSFFLM